MHETLRGELDAVGRRYRDLWRSAGLAVGWAVLAGVGGTAVLLATRANRAVPGWCVVALLVAAGVLAVTAFVAARRGPGRLWVARRIERHFPDLNARLLTALEQRPDPATRRLDYLQERVVGETLEHAHDGRWATLISPGLAAVALWAQRGALAAVVVVLGLMLLTHPRHGGRGAASFSASPLTVEPGDTAVERGTGLLVLARAAGAPPGDVRLVFKDAAGHAQSAAMSKSLDDPVFAARVPSVTADLQYAVQYDGGQTPWFTATVFDYPELKTADVDLAFPAYTRLPAKRFADVRSVTAVEGTTATLTLRLNKPVARAELLPPSGGAIALAIDPAKPDKATLALPLTQSQKYRVHLVDADGRENKQPAAELAVYVNPNRPPVLKPVTPGRDVDVSPIQELQTGVGVWDDFGVVRAGIAYGLAGQPERELVLAGDVPGGQKRDVRQLIALEALGAQPDQLLSYHFWAEDYGPDGKVRRTSGDLYFAEVRPFEEIFRQGEQPSANEQQQQQGGNGQQAEELAELQKQIVAATWKLVRRETGAAPTAAFASDVTLVRQSQASAREQAVALGEKLNDARSKGHLQSVLDHMDKAVAALDTASAGHAVAPLTPALASEQAAYQALLKLRAREFEVTRGRQQQQGRSESSASGRRQQQLDQLQLDQEQNRYESQRNAAPQEAENPQQRETRQVLSRLKELAQRQEDLNRQLQELKSALEQAKTEQQREELQRQLSRLRDQQDQQLRDTDELRDRMDRPENQEAMSEARQQLEQAREQVRRASQSLAQDRVPEAATSGARAGEQLNNLRDQVRKGAAGQLGQAMTDLRQQARALDEKQQQLTEQLNKSDAASGSPGLRDTDDRKGLTDQLAQQKQQLDRLTETMRQTIDAADSTEPLVAKQLYDTLRQSAQQRTDQALDTTRQLLDRGFTNEARQAAAEAGKGVTQLRQGVEQAATGVLGDEAESLRRARTTLDRLTQDLQREADRNRPADAATANDGAANGTPATRPSGGRTNAGPATRPGNTAAGPATRPGDRDVRDDRAASADGTPTTRPDGATAGPTAQDGQSPTPDRAPRQGGLRGREDANAPGGERPGQPRGNEGGRQPDAAGAEQAGRPRASGADPAGRPSDTPNDQDRSGAPGTDRDASTPPGNARNDPRSRPSGRTADLGGPGEEERSGPLTGEGFRDWSDRLRDVEEMVSDPALRDRAARIRERVRDLRAELKRHSKEPNWSLVQKDVTVPLVELRDRVSQELLRRESPDALVPLDREAVPPQYAEQVKRYYERLGAGR